MRKVYFILGCTACGKGAVGQELARRLGGHILSVDSMKVYRRMDIGTAKPSAQARAEIPHYGIDLVEPSESFSVARYLDHAETAVEDIRRAGAIPLAVGGTSLYIMAMTEGLFEGPPADEAIRAELLERIAKHGAAELHAELSRVDPVAAGRIHPNDEKRIIRALEVYRQGGVPISELQKQWDSQGKRCEAVRIGLRREKQDQHSRTNARVRRMVEMGLLREVESLLAEPAGLSDQAAQAVGYAEIIDHLTRACTFEKAVERIKINTRRLAKKQRTWHRRWRDVTWFDLGEDESAKQTADRILREISFE
jgi:tRNA dimethylallyltransferase